MFVIFAFICLNKYFCVEKTAGQCKSKCPDLPEDTEITSDLPNIGYTEPDTEVTLYLSESMTYPSHYNSDKKISHIIPCDESIVFTFKETISELTIGDDWIRVGLNKIIYSWPTPMLLQFEKRLDLVILKNGNCPVKSIILKATQPDLFIMPLFENEIQCSISISEDSNNINIYNIDDKVQKMFTNTEKLNEISKTYYCISDKETKCSDYSNYNPTVISSINEISGDSVVVIVETTDIQIYEQYTYDRFIKFIGLEGSNIVYKTSIYTDNPDHFYVFFNGDSVETSNSIFEGKGSFTFHTPTYIYLFPRTTTNSIDFTLKRNYIDDIHYSRIFGPTDKDYSFVNKIKVPELYTFHGLSQLAGLFEDGKYSIVEEEIRIDDVNKLYQFQVEYATIRFEPGTYEIPPTYKYDSDFGSYILEKDIVTFDFKNVHYFYDSTEIENAFRVVDGASSKLIIHPAKYFEFDINKIEKSVDIVISNDIIINNRNMANKMQTKENEYSCNFKGSGKVSFVQPEFREKIENLCQKEETVIFEDFTSTLPDYYVCVGQSSLEQCKSEIKDVDSITGVTWLWIADINRIISLQNVKKVYLTDKQIYSDFFDTEITLTKNAELTISCSKPDLQIFKNKVNKITSEAPTAKLIIVYSSIDSKDGKIKMVCNESPSEIDLTIYFDIEKITLGIYPLCEYKQNSIKLKGNSFVYIRDYELDYADIFDKTDSIVFMTKNDKKIENICVSDTFKKCFQIQDDFIFITSLDDISTVESEEDYLSINILIPLTLSMDFKLDYNKYNIFFVKGSSLTFDVPDNSKIILVEGSVGIEIIGKSNSLVFGMRDENIPIVLNIKKTIFLDILVEEVKENSFLSKFELKTEESTIEIISNYDFATKVHSIDKQYLITIQDDISIISPFPESIQPLVGTNSVTFSGICVYLNEEGKSLCGTKTSKSLEESKTSDIDTRNIPSTWSAGHYLYFVNSESAEISLTDASTMSYFSDGVIINEKCKVITGSLIINSLTEFSFNVDLPPGYPIISYMYFFYIDCSKNKQTNFYTGTISCNQIAPIGKCIFIGGFDANHKLTVNFAKPEDFDELRMVTGLGGKDGINYVYGNYEYICYASSNEAKEKCQEPNYYLVTDVSSLIYLSSNFPDLPILLTKNIVIPELSGKSFSLKAIDENVEITFSNSPKSVNILENNQVQIKYDDSSSVTLLDKMKISVEIKDNLELSVSGTLQSQLTFVLNSDVLISTNSPITTDFTINVVKNDFHLYSKNVDRFGSIFGDNLEMYPVICSYESGAESLCTESIKDTIQNVFKLPFNFKEVELVLSTNTQEITLPTISNKVDVIIKSEASTTLTINTVSSIQLNAESVIINDYWVFKGKIEILSVKLDSRSSISIPELISKPISLLLTDANSLIDLRSCIKQSSKQITFIKFGETENKVSVIGTDDAYNNFVSLLVKHEGVTFNMKDDQKYLCICKDSSCDKCKEGIEGFITNSDSITTDPGENVNIRIYIDIEISSELFSNEHNVIIDPSSKLTLNNVVNVYQNIEDILKVDNLIFSDGNNMIIKPKASKLNITMSKVKSGPEFTINFTNYLILESNIKEEGTVASIINVKGSGELNLNGYPSEKVVADPTIRKIKGIYIICNSKADQNVCIYDTYDDYSVIKSYDNFENAFDKDSNIVVIIDTFTGYLDVNIDRLNYQKLIVTSQKSSSHLLSDDNKAKIRFLSTKVLTNKADSTTSLDGSNGGISFSNADSDFFVVAFDDKLTIKQEGVIDQKLKPIVVQPRTEKATIVVDDNVNIEKQQVKIDAEKNIDLTVFVGDKSVKDENIKKFIDTSDSKGKIELVVKKGEPDNDDDDDDGKGGDDNDKGLNGGQIAGIVVGVVAFVAIVVVVVIVIIKKRKNKDNSSNEVSDQA